MNQDAQKAQGGKPFRPRGRGKGKESGGATTNIAQLVTSIATLQSSVEKVGGSLKKTEANVRGMMKNFHYTSDDNDLFSEEDDAAPVGPLPNLPRSNRHNNALAKTGVKRSAGKRRRP